MRVGFPLGFSKQKPSFAKVTLLLAALMWGSGRRAFGQAASGPQPTAAPPTPAAQSADAAATPTPRGGKLMLKDGTFQLVREYEVDGDRVRYYSIEQHQWEEMPGSLVDWDATKKADADEAARKAALIAKVHAQEAARGADAIDVDASIEISKGVFLPEGEGVFLYDGDKISKVPPVDADIKFSKAQMLKQVLVPVPIVPSRHTVSLNGTRAKMRVQPGQIELYMRTADGHDPDVQLIQARVHNGKRDLENLDELFHQTAATGVTELPIQRWEIARGVYRYTVMQSIAPGEYALAEIVPGGGTSLYFWDFGVEGATEKNDKKK
jgi:hypothetical protein